LEAVGFRVQFTLCSTVCGFYITKYSKDRSHMGDICVRTQ
jgi:hypothetical protein